MDVQAAQPSKVEVYAVITRADGTTQPLGLICARYTWRNPWRKMTWPVRKHLADLRIKRANAGR